AGDLVLDPGPDLVRVRERIPGPSPFRPGAGQQPGFVVQRIRALATVMSAEVRLPVVPEDACQGLPDTRGREQVPEADDRGEPLSEHLVGQAANPVLVPL